MQGVAISGTGLYVPEQVISNEELVAAFNQYVAGENQRNADAIARGEQAALPESSVEFILKASGIQRRHVIEKSGILDPNRLRPRFTERPNESLSMMAEMGVAAAKEAMAQAGRTADDIDAVICAASNMQRAYPAMAIEIQNALGIQGYGFDMNVACSSATFGMTQAINAIRSGSVGAVLVINPEITSAHHCWSDRDCHFIFGDICTAILLEPADKARKGSWEVLGTKLVTRFSNNIRNNAGFVNRSEDTDLLARDKLFMQEGRKVFKEVCPMAAEHIATHLETLDIAPAQGVRRYWLHQANLSMNQLIARKLLDRDATADDAPVILDEYANTASAGSIIAFHQHRADLACGDVGVICSFGAGYSIGSVVVRKM